MGTKTQVTAKDSSEKSEWRCDDCERHFLTLSALKSHTIAKHPEKYKQMFSNEIETREGKKTAFVPPTSRVSKRLQKRNQSNDIEETSTENKTIFQCPRCEKQFQVYFSAARHIKNRHRVDQYGNPVPADSPDLIKPIRKELNQSQSSNMTQESDTGSYCCLACKQVFHSVAEFDKHVESTHNESISVIILANMTEFLNWKKEVEEKQRVKYLTLSNTTQKQYYQCNYVSPKNSTNVTNLCPSVMILREFSKGIHIRYHKSHHHTNAIKTLQRINVNTNKNDAFDDLLKSDVGIYSKLKEVMQSIMEKASKLNSAKLTPLYESALEMQEYIKSVEEENASICKTSEENNNSESDNSELENVKLKVISENDKLRKVITENVKLKKPITENVKLKKVMTDNQIVKALEVTRTSSRLKRKSEGTPALEPKKVRKVGSPNPGTDKKLSEKPDSQSSGTKNKTLSENTSLKENNSQIDLACNERFESPKPNIVSPFIQSPSFNDTYKQFIGSTVSPVTKTEKQTTRRPKREVVKTKMGQFTPSPKREERKMKFESEQFTLSPKGEERKVKLVSEQFTPNPKREERKLKIESENVLVTKKKKVTKSLKNFKLEDVDYEVVEQENDCNILILKI